jgi:cytochrome c oxidase assembly protein subunit 15
MKLYPAIVTAHLIGGIGLLVLLAAQAQAYAQAPLALPPRLFTGVVAVALLSVVQIVLGGWVSTNYAVLACSDFPTCQGAWWPDMDFEHGFAVVRELGVGKLGGYLPFEALTAIHYTHRLAAYVVLAALLLLAWRLRATGMAVLRPWSLAIAGVALWQLLSGLSNVVLGWPVLAAVAHTGGAALLAVLLTFLIARAAQAGNHAPWPITPARQVHSAP